MKNSFISLLIPLLAFTLISCNGIEDEHIYTENEIPGLFIDLQYSGWEDIYNDTNSAVLLVLKYPGFEGEKELRFNIKPGEYARLNIGAMSPGEELSKCSEGIFTFGNGQEIIISPQKDDPWSVYFLTNYESKDEYIIVELPGRPIRKVRHDMVALTYHFNNELIDIWRSNKGQ